MPLRARPSNAGFRSSGHRDRPSAPPQLRGGRADDDVVRHLIVPARYSVSLLQPSRARLMAAGFSLIEMITTMSILAILMVIASPGLASLTSGNALASAQNDLAAAMMLARGEAMKRGVPVGVAATAPIVGAEFTGGWSVFVDSNGNGQFDVGETVVRQQPAYRNDVHITTVSGATTVTFNPRGFLVPSTLVSFNLCSSAVGKGYLLRIEPVGLADVAQTAGCP
jgi:type IV fimbrial biogenesis protein FimT